MPKNPLTELNEIFVKSQRLTVQQSDAGSTSRQLNRGIAELGEASRSLASRADTLGMVGLAEDPHSRKIFNEVNAITLNTVQDSVSLEGTDLEGYLAHHHDMILLTAIEEARQISDNYLYEMQQRVLLNEWEVARTHFMENLGYRSNKWTVGAIGAANTSYSEAGDRQSLLEFHPETSFMGTPGVSGRKGAPSSTQPSTAVVSDKAALPKLITSHADCAHKIALHQCKAVASRNENIHPCKMLLSSLKEVMMENKLPQQQQQQQLTQQILSPKDLIGYRSLLSLLASMTGEDRYGSEVTPGYFATICSDPAQVDLIQLKEKKSKLTKGAKLFFEDQIMATWDHKIDEAIRLNELDLSSRGQGRTIQMKLQKLVQYEYRNHMIPKQCKLVDVTIPAIGGMTAPTIVKNVPIWALVYYYLRSGNLDLAVKELQELYLQFHWEEMYSVLCILKAFIGETNDYRELRSPRAGGGSSASSGGGFGFSTPRHGSFGNSAGLTGGISALSAGDAEVVETALKQCKLHYQRESMKDEQSIDPYYLFILNLIALIDPRDLNGALIPNFSFEDFLWAHLWFISTSRLVHDLLATAGSSRGGTTATSGSHLLGAHSPFSRKPAAIAVETTSEENELLELVYAYGGAHYFDHDGQSPYKYVLLLCCCHRFGDAFTYLWMSGKSFPAIHLLMIGLYYGLVLPHVPLLQNPSHPLVNSDYHQYHHQSIHGSMAMTTLTTASIANVFHLTPGHLLQLFLSQPLFQAYPDYGLDYTLLLQTKWMEAISYQSEEVFKVQVMKFDEMIIERLMTFLLGLNRSQRDVILGKPTISPAVFQNLKEATTENALDPILSALTNRQYHSPGVIDQYLKSDKKSLLCQKLIYYYHTVEKDVMKVLDYYYLLGGYTEVMTLLSQELMKYWIIESLPSPTGGEIYRIPVSSNNSKDGEPSGINPLLLQKKRQRDYWRQQSEELMRMILVLSQRFDQQSHQQASSRGGGGSQDHILHLLFISTETFNNFHLLMILYQVIDEVFAQRDYVKALLLLEMNHLFPTIQSSPQPGTATPSSSMEGMVFFLNPVLKVVIEDLLLLILTCLYEFMKQYQLTMQSKGSGNGTPGNDRDLAREYLQMERRYEAIAEFLMKFKDQFQKRQVLSQEFQKLQSYMTLH